MIIDFADDCANILEQVLVNMSLPSQFLINQEDEGVGATYIKTNDDYLDK
jgi:hypothetical protein